MGPSLLKPEKNAKSSLLLAAACIGLTFLALLGQSLICNYFGIDWLFAAEGIVFFLPGFILAGLSGNDFKVKNRSVLLVSILAGVGAGGISHVLLPYWQEVFGVPMAHDKLLRSYLHLGWWPGFALNLGKAALLPAFCEEVFFRGLIFSKLEKTGYGRGAFFLSALLFAGAHGVWVYFPLYFLLGLGAAHIYRKGGLPAAILAHFVFNAAGLVIWQLG